MLRGFGLTVGSISGMGLGLFNSANCSRASRRDLPELVGRDAIVQHREVEGAGQLPAPHAVAAPAPHLLARERDHLENGLIPGRVQGEREGRGATGRVL